MTDEQAEKLITYVNSLRHSGVNQEEDILRKLSDKFEGTEDQFKWALEMISTGGFRAAIISSGKNYPKSNIKIEDDPILKNAFRLKWIELKGEQHFKEHYLKPKPRWWEIWKK